MKLKGKIKYALIKNNNDVKSSKSCFSSICLKEVKKAGYLGLTCLNPLSNLLANGKTRNYWNILKNGLI